jgi:hypothetical protein
MLFFIAGGFLLLIGMVVGLTSYTGELFAWGLFALALLCAVVGLIMRLRYMQE